MNKPDFLKILISSIFFDVVLMMLVPFAGYGFWLIGLIMLYLIPIYVSVLGLKGTWDCISAQVGNQNRVSVLSRLISGSSLTYLLFPTGLAVWGQLPRHSGPFETLAYIYLLVLIVRFSGAAVANIILSIPSFIFGKGLDRLNALSAAICAVAGLHVTMECFKAQNGADYSGILVFAALNVGYGMVWGGALQWFARALSGSDESLAR